MGISFIVEGGIAAHAGNSFHVVTTHVWHISGPLSEHRDEHLLVETVNDPRNYL